VGTAHGYAEKIYGGTLGPAETSWSKFEGVVQCWPMQQIYQRLWEFFSDSIVEVPVDLKRLDNVAKNNHVVFSSMPLNVLLDPEAKLQDHFACETVYVYPRMITPWAGTSPHGPNTIVYNGWLAVQWYRQSRIFGQEWTEWPYSVGAEGVEEDLVRYGHEFNPLLLRQVVKPVVCTLPIHLSIPPNVRLIGRYGQWRKGALVHEAYVDVVNHLEHIRKHVSEISSASMTSPRTFE
jgi:hypothetical protein